MNEAGGPRHGGGSGGAESGSCYKRNIKIKRRNNNNNININNTKEKTMLSPTEICLNLIGLRDHTQTNSFFHQLFWSVSLCHFEETMKE